MSKKLEAFVVQGTCGEYGSRETWPVAVFASAEEASTEAKRLEARLTVARVEAKDRGGWYWDPSDYIWDQMRAAGDPLLNGDPPRYVSGDARDTYYYVLKVRLGPWTPGVPE